MSPSFLVKIGFYTSRPFTSGADSDQHGYVQVIIVFWGKAYIILTRNDGNINLIR